MSSRLRSRNSTKISFFAFQDIITSVSGILILVTLLLATELESPTTQESHSADPELERKLAETLHQQTEVDGQNQHLQELIAGAETAPAVEKLEEDIARLRAQAAEERKKHANVTEQLAASESSLGARDRTLGLTDIKDQIQRTIQETEAIVRQENDVRQEMANLEQRVANIQARVLKLRERDGKLWLIPDKSSTTKEPILVTVSGKGIKVERFDRPKEAKEFSRTSARAQLKSYLADAKPLDQYVVFLIKPSGIELFDELVELARDRKFEVGFDALEEDKEVIFTTPPPLQEIIVPSGGQVTSTNTQESASNPNKPGQTNSPPTTEPVTNSPPPPPPTTKSWWQRFLEFIGIA